MKKLVLLCFLILISLGSASAQDWISYFSNSFIKLEYKEVDYQEPGTDVNKTLIVFKLSNLTTNKISIKWEQELLYGSKCYNCDGKNQEMNFTISLEPNSYIEGTPESHQTNGLVIFSKFNSPEIMKNSSIPLKNYELKNIQVLTVN